MKKKAIIFGITGQDGSYLSRYLLKKCKIWHKYPKDSVKFWYVSELIFVNGKNCISFHSSLENFTELLNELLNSESLIHEITSNAVAFAHKNHTWNARANYLLKLLNQISKWIIYLNY